MKNAYITKNYKKHIYFTSDLQNNKYKITREYLPNLNQKSQIPLNINITKDDIIKKDIIILDQIWDELEITWQYREAFYIYLKNMNDENRNNIIIQEKNNLKKYKKALVNLKKEISIREDNILLLKRYNNRLENFNNDDQIENIIDSVINIVKKLRKNAINIVKEYSKIESISKNYSNLEKINKKIIKAEYSYDPNYIYKMQDDLLFLKESALSKYFEMDNKYIDPFLTNFCTEAKGSNKKTVSNSNDIIGLINESRYALIQKKIFDKISQSNNTKELNIDPRYIKTLTRNFSTKGYRKIEFKREDRKENRLEKYLNQLKLNCPNKYTQLFVIKKNNFYELSNKKKPIYPFDKKIKPLTNLSILNDIKKIKGEHDGFKIQIDKKEQKIKVDYYTGDINNFLKLVEDKFPPNKIPQIIKNVFNLDESIYKKEFYLKGGFPKILVITNEGENDKKNIIGICPIYYEWKEDPKYYNLKISSIISNDINNYENHIKKFINFIKFNVKCDRIELKLIKDNLTENLVNLFRNELKFMWSNVQKDQKNKYQTITLYLQQNKTSNLSDIFILNNKSIITLDNKDKFLNEVIENKNDKFINQNNIYYSLLENKDIKCDFNDESKLKEISEIKNKMGKFSKIEKNYKIKEDNDIKTNLDKSALNKMNENGILYKLDLKINFANIYSVIMNDIYYNKITNEQMNIYQDENTQAIFYLIPSQDSPFSFNICEMNHELKNLLINDNSAKSIYDKFLDLNTNTSIKLLDQAKKSLYIPSFNSKKHLVSKEFMEISKNMKLIEESTKNDLYISCVNEFINVEFKTDVDMNNNFIDNDNYEKNNDNIIKDDFIIGIFRNDIIKDNNLSLIQILYIEKNNFITKSNINNK